VAKRASFEWQHERAFDACADEAAFAEVPTKPGVFALFAADTNAEPYVARCANLNRRVRRMLSADGGAGRRLNLRERTSLIAWAETGSEFEALLTLHHASVAYFGADQARRRLRLHVPFCVRMTMENAYPRAYVTNRVGKRRLETAFGPYASRAAAERALTAALDLFLLRRCTDELHPYPQHPGCVYSEMKMCLAPCFKGCSDERYVEEAQAVLEFLQTRGAALIGKLEAERNAASEACAFERAAAIHTRLEKVKDAARLQEEIVRPLAKQDALIVQQAAGGGSMVFAVKSGRLTHGFRVEFDGENTAEERLRTVISTGMDAAARESGDLGDHLALLKRWYYRPAKQRKGEILFPNADGSWPVRRVLNAVSRVTAQTTTTPESPAKMQTESTGGDGLD
jgi:excinuclease UvrABC nuclease subunit